MFATGGISGATAICFYFLYKCFFSKHRITSKCCGKELSLEVEAPTSKDSPIKNLEHKVNGSPSDGT